MHSHISGKIAIDNVYLSLSSFCMTSPPWALITRPFCVMHGVKYGLMTHAHKRSCNTALHVSCYGWSFGLPSSPSLKVVSILVCDSGVTINIRWSWWVPGKKNVFVCLFRWGRMYFWLIDWWYFFMYFLCFDLNKILPHGVKVMPQKKKKNTKCYLYSSFTRNLGLSLLVITVVYIKYTSLTDITRTSFFKTCYCIPPNTQ